MPTEQEKIAGMPEKDVKDMARGTAAQSLLSEKGRLASSREMFEEQGSKIERAAGEALGARLGRQRTMSGATLAGAAEAGVRAREQAASGLSKLQQQQSALERESEERQMKLQDRLIQIGTADERAKDSARDIDSEAQAYEEGEERGNYYEREAAAAGTQEERDRLLNKARDVHVKDYHGLFGMGQHGSEKGWISGGESREEYIATQNKKFGPIAGSSTVGS